jgi:2-oxoisovalerate dehydrogenase E1 component
MEITSLLLDINIAKKAFAIMCKAKSMAMIYDENKSITKYVHSTSRGHEAAQIALGLQLQHFDYVSPYYRDDSMLLALGFTPYELMLQLLAKGDDYFSGGRSYYCHPSSKRNDIPLIPHQSSATGMQAIPATGMAHGIQYLQNNGLLLNANKNPIVVCSLGDGSVTEGEVAEAFQFAVLKQLPILYFVQDNDWGISATAAETRTMNAFEYADGFKGMRKISFAGNDFVESYNKLNTAIQYVRLHRKPILVHCKVPLLGHHTSGVRKEWYRSETDLNEHFSRDPFPILYNYLLENGLDESELFNIIQQSENEIKAHFENATAANEPDINKVVEHEFAPTLITEEKGIRCPDGKEKVLMVDAALHAVEELLHENKNAIFFGQDVGRRLGGVFREAATLAEKFGDERVFNTAIQEAYIIGSTAGLSAVGVKSIVEIQFADYIWTGINQLVVELSKSCYLSMGKFPVQTVIRVPVGAYGSGGPYHSGSIESTLLTIKGIKVVYPSNAADMKGLMKAAFYDPNPVIMLEHKGLYWSKVPGTKEAMCVEPDANYILPLGKANKVLLADEKCVNEGNSIVVITYGMGVYWALNAAKRFHGNIEIIDLRTLYPLDEETVVNSVKKHGKALIVTEEPLLNSFAESLAGRISKTCFKYLDAPVETIGSANVPAIALNSGLEYAVLPNEDKVFEKMKRLIEY